MQIGGNEGEDDDGGGGDEVEVGTVPDGKNHGEKTRAESDPKNAFVHVGHGRAPRDINAGGKADDEEKKAEVGEGFTPRQESVLYVLARDEQKKSGEEPSDPSQTEGVIFKVGHFELNLCGGEVRSLLGFE